jgi:hypothetical protein
MHKFADARNSEVGETQNAHLTYDSKITCNNRDKKYMQFFLMERNAI